MNSFGGTTSFFNINTCHIKHLFSTRGVTFKSQLRVLIRRKVKVGLLKFFERQFQSCRESETTIHSKFNVRWAEILTIPNFPFARLGWDQYERVLKNHRTGFKVKWIFGFPCLRSAWIGNSLKMDKPWVPLLPTRNPHLHPDYHDFRCSCWSFNSNVLKNFFAQRDFSQKKNTFLSTLAQLCCNRAKTWLTRAWYFRNVYTNWSTFTMYKYHSWCDK